jgi:hypothetical protein
VLFPAQTESRYSIVSLLGRRAVVTPQSETLAPAKYSDTPGEVNDEEKPE